MTNQDRQRIVEQYLDVTIKHDFAGMRALMSEDFTIWMVPSAVDHGIPVPLEGRENFLEFAGRLSSGGTMWEPRGHKIEQFLFSEDSVAVRVRLIGDFANGDIYDNEYVFIYRFAGDRICEMREFTDTMFIDKLFRKAGLRH